MFPGLTDASDINHVMIMNREFPLSGIPVRRNIFRAIALSVLAMSCAPGFAADPAGGAPYVDSKAIKERFEAITAEDMDLLRQKKILLVSRSFGLNLFKGLTRMALSSGRFGMQPLQGRSLFFLEIPG